MSRRRSTVTTRRDRSARPAPDLVDRQFVAEKPNTLWVADITYVPTGVGLLYLAVVLDVWSHKIVGWRWRRICTSIEFGMRCRGAGIRPSMVSVGDCFDNAMCESFFASLDCELIDRFTFCTQDEARPAIIDFIEGFYTTRRRHSALGQRSPVQFERQQAVVT